MSAKNRRSNPGQHPVPQAQPQHQGQSQTPAALEYRAQRLLQALQEQEARSQATLARLELKERELDEKIREVNSIQSGLRRDIMSGNQTLLAFQVALQAFARQEVNIVLEAAVKDAIEDFTDTLDGRINEEAKHVAKEFEKLKMALYGVVDSMGKARKGNVTIPDVLAGLFLETAEIRNRGHV